MVLKEAAEVVMGVRGAPVEVDGLEVVLLCGLVVLFAGVGAQMGGAYFPAGACDRIPT